MIETIQEYFEKKPRVQEPKKNSRKKYIWISFWHSLYYMLYSLQVIQYKPWRESLRAKTIMDKVFTKFSLHRTIVDNLTKCTKFHDFSSPYFQKWLAVAGYQNLGFCLLFFNFSPVRSFRWISKDDDTGVWGHKCRWSWSRGQRCWRRVKITKS